MQSLPANCKRITHNSLAIGAQRSSPTSVSFVIHHDDFLSVLGLNPSITLAWEDPHDHPLAHEAGIYVPSLGSIFVTSNQVQSPFAPASSNEKTILISEFSRTRPSSSSSPVSEKWTRSDVPTDMPMPNGGTNYLNSLLFCAQGNLAGQRSQLVLMSPTPPYTTTTLLDSFHGREFNSLNDVIVHSDGSIWFTDPNYGSEQGFRGTPQLPNQVYRFDPANGSVRVMADGFGRPNGICFSPSEDTVYVTDTDWIHGDGSMVDTRVSSIYAFDVTYRHNSPFLTNRRLFAFADAGIPDGIKCDTVGNVYSGCGDGLSVWNAGGILLGKILIPGGVANFCFGEDGELFLLNETRFWVARVSESVQSAVKR